MTRDDATQATFGMLDGLASALGLVLAIAPTAGTQRLAQTIAALTVGAGVSMALGEWLSDRQGSLRRAAVMGFSTACGVLAPAIPWLVARGWPAYVASACVVAALGVLIAEIRPEPALPSYAKTAACILLAAGLALIAGSAA